MDRSTWRCWAEVDLDALRYNCRQLHSLLPPGGRLLTVLKADAYGHGAVPVARALEGLFPGDWIGVATMEEGLELREAGIRQPILILGWTSPKRAGELAENQLTQALLSAAYTQRLAAAAQTAGVTVQAHLKLDTGMTRVGYLCHPNHIDKTISQAAQAYGMKGVEVTGIFTHLSSAYLHGEEDEAYTQMQFQRFSQVCQGLSDMGIQPGLRHCANSAATVNCPEFALDMCRAGTVLYGLLPESAKLRKVDFRPVMTWKARVGLIRPAPKGSAVSYNRLAVTGRDTRLAVITAGDADGYMRQLTNLGRVSIRGHICPVVGRVCMDMFMVDVTDFPDIQEEDEVLLLGRDQDGEVPCEWIFRPLDLGPSSVTCNIRPRVPRVYLHQEG